jgi:phage terminase large subunit-like protein
VPTLQQQTRTRGGAGVERKHERAVTPRQLFARETGFGLVVSVVLERRRVVPGKPFTLRHFRAWARELVLDTDELWELEPFQESFVEDVFRGFSISWLVVPEGNGKTTLLAGLALYHVEHSRNAYVAVAASTRDQAEWIYRQAEAFVNNSERDGEFRCLEGYRRIRFDATGSRIQVFAADDRSGDGAIATLYMLDELHRHKNLALYRTWSGKLRKRNGQLLAISTAGEVGSEFEEERTRFRQSGVVTTEGAFTRAERENAVLHDWGLVEGANVSDLEAVKAANPFSGISAEDLRQKRDLPGMTPSHWARFTCNRASRAESAAIQEAEWHGAATGERIPEGQPIDLGLDLGWIYDTTAMVPLWIRDSEFRLLGPATILEPPRDGTQLDAHLVEKALLDIHARNPIQTVVMDMTNGEQLSQWIQENLGADVVNRGQGNALAVLDYARFMEALREGWLHHSGDPGLKSHALNAIAVTLPGGDTKFYRPKESRTVNQTLQRLRVIDALVAAAMVHTHAASLLGKNVEPFILFG